MNVGTFSESIQEYLRASGYSQKELAGALGLHPKVLSRKLNGSGNAHLTHLEVQSIITTLAGWRAITTQDEVLHLLELAQVEPTIFSSDEWRTPPLSKLTAKRTQSIPSSDSSISTSTMRHNLPAPTTRLIGREWAVERLRQLLGRAEVRIVTLVGSGGSGKTRLALQVASELVGAFTQGVWFVALSGVSDPAQVPMSIIQALNITPMPGLPPFQSLITYLRNKQLLLLLDNFEQVGEATAVVDEMLAAVPGLKVLVTSRVVLHLYGEHKFSVPPLDVPDTSIVLETTELAQYEAVQLFVERAQAVVPDFALTTENGTVIAQICARVDGLPLALELAAARVNVLPPALLLERLSRARLPLLTRGARNLPSRQQTLRNTILWSYDLLSSVEQAWFPRLGVFIGSWSLEAAEAMMQEVAADLEDTPVSGSLLDMLAQLVDNSLLVRLPVVGGQARFTMLETLREYALEQLTAQGEFERLRDWHACYYLRIVEAAEIGLRGPQQRMWLVRLVADRDNFRAALEWLLQRARAGMIISTPAFFEQGSIEESKEVAMGKTLSSKRVPAVELCLRLAAAFRPYWEWQGYLTEGRDRLGAALAVPLEDGVGEGVLAARAKALSEAARLVCLQNDQARALALAEESIALWRQLDDPGGLATALLHRGWTAHAIGEYEVAKRVYWEGLQHLSPTGDTWLRAQLLSHLGAASGFTADFEQMQSFYSQSRELFEQVGDKSATADVLKDQGGMSLLQGKYTEAIDCLLKSIKLCYELDHKQYIATGLGLLSFAFGMREEPDPVLASIYSAQLQGASEGLMDTIGLTPWTRSHPLVQMVRQQIRSRVDEQRWEAALAAGRALTVEQAIDLAYQLGEDVLP
ncbi:MAG: NB-ARC domain-containing protein [Ktedonobacteraceae bacterium]